jgi:BRCT domain type II-containing protein
MARKVVNRKALREESEAAEKAGLTPKKKKAAKKKKATSRSSRAKAAVEVRKKVFWGVFNQSLKRVATFEFDQKKDAEKKAQTLSQSGKSPHFVQKVKEAIDE